MSNINCSAFKRIKQNELKTFTDKVYLSTNGKTVYAPIQQYINDMNAQAIIFQQALVEAANGGKEKNRLKDEAKIQLFIEITRVAKMMDIQWMRDDQDYLKEEAGFTLNKTPERKNVTFMNPPTNLQAYNEMARGQITVKWKKAENAILTAFDISEEEGVWKNGMYSEKESIELTFPFGAKIKIRAKSIGPDSVISLSTEPVEVAVS